MSLLLVEGKLDVETLGPLMLHLPAGLTIEAGGSKTSLEPKCRDRRAARPPVEAYYLRDRDFDHEPPEDTSTPTPDSKLGWRWSRHELENYLLEPEALAGAVKCSIREAEAALLAAAQQIIDYTAARWTVGIVRRSLPPFRELPTRPASLGEGIKIPDLQGRSLESTRAWVHAQVGAFAEKVRPLLAEAKLDEDLQRKRARLAALTTVSEVLVWHSGKDLMAAFEPAFYRAVAHNPVELQRRLVGWVREHSLRMLELVPEWSGLLALLSAK